MAWTTPRTWVVGEIVTAAQLNTHVRDNFNAVTRTEASTYVGDGTTDRTISTAFTPKFVIVVGDASGGAPYAFSNVAGSAWGLHFDGTGASDGISGSSSQVPRLTVGGFLVSGTAVENLNRSGVTYHYIAFS